MKRGCPLSEVETSIGKLVFLSFMLYLLCQGSEGSNAISQRSAHLLQDFNKVLYSSKHSFPKQVLWSSHETTFAKLRSFLPPILSESDLSELDPQQSTLHTLPSLIYNELRLHNQCSVSLHASLELLASCLQSQVPLTAQIGRDILPLTNDVMPLSWVHHLPEPLGGMTSLISAVKLLRARVAFYRRTLHSGTLPSKLNPLLFSSPQDLISSRACSFALECQLSASSVLTEGKVGEAVWGQTLGVGGALQYAHRSERKVGEAVYI